MKNNKSVGNNIKLLVIASCFTSLSHFTHAAEVTLSNYYSATSNTVTSHTVGAEFAEIHWNSADYASYATMISGADGLELHAFSSIDASHIDQLGYDLVTAEASVHVLADLVISGGTGKALLNIDYLLNRAPNNPPGTDITGVESVHLFDEEGRDMLFANSGNPDPLKNIELDFGSTYKIELWLSAYTNAQPFTSVSYQKDFSATLSATAVPLPSAAWLFGSGFFGLVSLARKRY